MCASPQDPDPGTSSPTGPVRATNAQVIRRLLSTPPTGIPDPGYGLRVLVTAGRATARPHLTPVGVLRHGGHRYLVCPDRARDWPRNLRHQPHCQIRAGNRREHLVAVPVSGAEAVAAVQTYLTVVNAPWAIRAFGLSAITRDQIAARLPRMAVFRLLQADGGLRHPAGQPVPCGCARPCTPRPAVITGDHQATGPDEPDRPDDRGGAGRGCTDWFRQARCRGMTIDLFFPFGTGTTAAGKVQAARKVCSQCQVRRACLEYALAGAEDYGIWGGTTPTERRWLRAARRECDMARRAWVRRPGESKGRP